MLRRGRALLLGAILAGGTLAGCLGAGLTPPAAWTAAVTVLCATWWVTEPIPIPATSLIPFAVLPLAGVLNDREVATAYGHPLVLLLLGGFMLSTVMARSGAHRRLAYLMLRLVGGHSQRRIVLGFMLASALCSMWISNTATVLMMLPIALAVLEQDDSGALDAPLLLGIAYAASIGGLGTPIGTPPNVVFLAVYREHTGWAPSFLHWMQIGVPAVILLLPLAWLWITRRCVRGKRLHIPALGAWRSPERRVLYVFGATALAWMTRTAPFGGWSALFNLPGAGDSTVALVAVTALFVLPDGEGQPMLDWKTAASIPWGLLLLFGGGIAIAKGFDASGLSAVVGQALSGMAAWPVLATTLLLCLAVTFLTEVTSNTATTTLLMPILAAAGTAAGQEPAWFMVPAALSASCAFMLPVATPPNAVVFGTDRVSIRRMAREGFALNLAGAVVLSALCVVMLPRLFPAP
jgi:sodium-dependent dicarboxylate transporter 2/3/5